MALIDRKVNDWSQAVSSLDDKPKMTAAALKAAFDSNSNQLKPAINGIIDDLTGSQGALNIGLTPIDGLSGSNVQAVLQAISLLIKSNDVDLASLERLFTADGANLVGLQPVNGVSASNLQQAIISLADTISKIDPYLGNPVAISQGGTGANDSPNALYNLGAKPNDNLLDNPYFNINQRGLNPCTFNGISYGFDRWINDTGGSGTVEKLLTGEISMICTYGILAQSSYISNPEYYIGKTCTASILVTEIDGILDFMFVGLTTVWKNIRITQPGLYSITTNVISDGNLFCTSIRLSSGSVKFLGVKTEKGEKQTLAYQDKQEQLHLLEVADNVNSLLKCQKYLYINNNVFVSAIAMQAISTTILHGVFAFPAAMRIVPTLTKVKLREITTGAILHISTASYLINEKSLNAIYNIVFEQPEQQLKIGCWYTISFEANAEL